LAFAILFYLVRQAAHDGAPETRVGESEGAG